MLALQRLLVRFHELAGDEDEKVNKRRGLQGAPSLKNFDVLYTLRRAPIETPSNLMFGSSYRSGAEPANKSAKYLYVEWDETIRVPASEDIIETMCKAISFASNSEVQKDKNFKDAQTRAASGQAHARISSARASRKSNEGYSPAERYVVDFVKFVRKHRATEDGQGAVTIEHALRSDLSRGSNGCEEHIDDGFSALCFLARKTELRFKTYDGKLEVIRVNEDLLYLRKMIVEWHHLDSAMASRRFRDLEFYFDGSGDEIVYMDSFIRSEGKQKRQHSLAHRWCKVPYLYSGRIKDRDSQMNRAIRHEVRTSLHAALSDGDEQAVVEFLFREPRVDKWRSSNFPLRHDGDNAIVLYDLEKFETEQRMTMWQRNLFELGVHASQSREHWLGYLREHPLCLTQARCRVANDAILFSSKFDPATCTDLQSTPCAGRSLRRWLAQRGARLSGHNFARAPSADLDRAYIARLGCGAAGAASEAPGGRGLRPPVDAQRGRIEDHPAGAAAHERGRLTAGTASAGHAGANG
eukprot:TRINITY_DN12801_c0_g1_i2.p1 TRINITY_DN12801_c0_g1~~TRINITY_DN12801_c0_g1_i2.p1  ORF type:complete len:606 (-),score=75.49 TRINITY_DN12801_c0_g1_i2:278-1849(-)